MANTEAAWASDLIDGTFWNLTMRQPRLFRVGQPDRPTIGPGDIIVLVGIAGLLYAALRLAIRAPAVIQGPLISLAPSALPWYAGLSVARMAAAYILSLLFALAYGYLAAYNRRAEIVLIPLLDVLQSVPILSFLPVVLLSFSAILPEQVAAELASIALIFTSQAWNLTFAWYQSLNTSPKELREASAIFQMNSWLRFKTLELPFAALSLIWNSMMSWAGGWFFLMAAEIFTVGQRNFRLPGLGTYLQEAANQGNLRAIGWGLATLILVIVALDQLVWRPLLAWSDRFKVEMIESETPLTSWFYELLRGTWISEWLSARVWRPIVETWDRWLVARFPARYAWETEGRGRPWAGYLPAVAALAALAYGAYRAGVLMAVLPAYQWASEWERHCCASQLLWPSPWPGRCL
jgi:NitT/TauT family transport system permease protein